MHITLADEPQQGNQQTESSIGVVPESSPHDNDELLATLAHELLTPLTCILGWAQVAQASPEVTEQALAVIEHHARRQHRIIKQVLEMMRHSQYHIPSNLTPCDFSGFVEQHDQTPRR